MQALLSELGHTGHSVWWILVELCAEKLEKESEEEFTEGHCSFVFNERLLRDSLRLSRAKLERILHQYSTMALLRFQIVGAEFKIEMPKLLECLDRDAKRARTERGPTAPKKKIKKEKKNKEGWLEIEFERISELYTTTFPGTTTGPHALTRFDEQFKTLESVKPLEIAIKNYRAYLDSLTWDRSAKTTFANFLGTKSSGYFWTDHKKLTLVPAPKAEPGSGQFTGGYE